MLSLIFFYCGATYDLEGEVSPFHGDLNGRLHYVPGVFDVPLWNEDGHIHDIEEDSDNVSWNTQIVPLTLAEDIKLEVECSEDNIKRIEAVFRGMHDRLDVTTAMMDRLLAGGGANHMMAVTKELYNNLSMSFSVITVLQDILIGVFDERLEMHDVQSLVSQFRKVIAGGGMTVLPGASSARLLVENEAVKRGYSSITLDTPGVDGDATVKDLKKLFETFMKGFAFQLGGAMV